MRRGHLSQKYPLYVKIDLYLARGFFFAIVAEDQSAYAQWIQP